MMMGKQHQLRDVRRKEKFFIDDAFLDRYARILGVTSSAVYMSLCRHANRNQECFPSQELIAREHHLSQRTVRRAIRRLREANIIAMGRNKSREGRWWNNNYILLDRGQWESPEDIKALWIRGQKQPTPGDNKDRTMGQESLIKDTHKKDTHIKDREKDFIFSLNEEGEWIGQENNRPQIDKVKHDDITGTKKDPSYTFKDREPENIKRKIAEIRVELGKRLGWENKDKR